MLGAKTDINETTSAPWECYIFWFLEAIKVLSGTGAHMSKYTIEGPCNQNFECLVKKLDTHDTFNIEKHRIFSQLPLTSFLRTFIQKFAVDYGSIILDYLKNWAKNLFYIFYMHKGNDTDDTNILTEILCLSFRKVCIGIHENVIYLRNWCACLM